MSGSTLYLLAVAITFPIALLGVYVASKLIDMSRRNRIQEIIQTVREQPRAEHKPLLRQIAGSGWADRLSAGWGIQETIRQAGLDWPASQFFVVSAVLAAIGAVVGWKVRILIVRELSVPAFAIAAGMLPLIFVRYKRSQRMAEFEKQFPEALDLLSRALRAGHALSSSLEMLATESPAPLGPEFRRVYDEQNLGAPLETALKDLGNRVPLVDVRFFIAAVLLKQEAGGNLGEILRNLSRVIRERFTVKGQVKAVSAHGRITALILTVLPLATIAGLSVVAPDYLDSMAKDSDGKYLIAGAFVMMALGYFIMRRITNIKV